MGPVSASPEAVGLQVSPNNLNGVRSAQIATAQTEFISFAIGDDQYGVDIMAVREIKGWSDVSHLPKQPEYVRGVLNLRGAIVPIVDLRCRFGQGLTETTPLHIVIIVQIGSRQVGLIGDRVLDIVSVDAAQIQPVPRTAQSNDYRLSVRSCHARQHHDRADRSAKSAVHSARQRRRPCVRRAEIRRTGGKKLIRAKPLARHSATFALQFGALHAS